MSENSIVVRRATLDDAAGIGQIHGDAWEVGFAEVFNPDVLAAVVERRKAGMWEDVLANLSDKAIILVAEQDQEVVGYCSLRPVVDDAVEISGFYVAPRCWGKGVAQRLMEVALEWARAQGAQRMMLYTLERTQQSRRFYEKEGFTLTGAKYARDFGGEELFTLVQYSKDTAPTR